MRSPDPRALARELLAFNTINPPGMERACARHLGTMLERAGFRVSYHEFAESRTSLIAEIGGRDAKTPVEGAGRAAMQDAIRLNRLRVRRFGADVALEGEVES